MLPTEPEYRDGKQEKAQVLAHIRKESLDIYNRIHSISEDAQFVNEVNRAYPDLPLVPNLRCGSWYTDPKLQGGEAYFKSTDGHFGNWGFNLRRPNIQLLPLISLNRGLIIVDSTRSGKRLPDALSKTIPIWCAVINRAVAKTGTEPIGCDIQATRTWDTNLYTPHGAVSAQEHHRIEGLLDKWADDLASSSYVLPPICLPLRPLWITPSTSTFPEISSVDSEQAFLPVICVSASKQVQVGSHRREAGYIYIQGSGDDHELWGMGLSPSIFWANQDVLLASPQEKLPDLIASLVSTRTHDVAADCWATLPTPVTHVDSRILLCTLADLPDPLPVGLPGIGSAGDKDAKPALHQSAAYLAISSSTSIPSQDRVQETGADRACRNPTSLRLHLPEGKRGQIQLLQETLPLSMSFIGAQLDAGRAVIVCCDTGRDISVGIAVAALQMFFDDNGEYYATQPLARTKETIRSRLQWIIASRPQANPSRTTLKRVNEFLLSSTSFRTPLSK